MMDDQVGDGGEQVRWFGATRSLCVQGGIMGHVVVCRANGSLTEAAGCGLFLSSTLDPVRGRVAMPLQPSASHGKGKYFVG